MNKILCSILIFVCFTFKSILIAQVKQYRLWDQLNSKPIKYAGIKSVNSDVASNSDSLGYFTFNSGESIFIDAVGFEKITKDLNVSASNIDLLPVANEIENIQIHKRENRNFTTIDTFKTFGIRTSYANTADKSSSWIIGNYFENKSYKTKFLKSISVYTISNLKEVPFNIRIYNVDSNHIPTNEYYTENIIVYAKKGKHKTTVDLSDLNLRIPDNGLVIAVDWLKINSNIYEFSYTTKENRTLLKKKNYAPNFGTIKSKDKGKTLILKGEKWDPVKSFSGGMFEGYSTLAMELVLSD